MRQTGLLACPRFVGFELWARCTGVKGSWGPCQGSETHSHAPDSRVHPRRSGTPTDCCSLGRKSERCSIFSNLQRVVRHPGSVASEARPRVLNSKMTASLPKRLLNVASCSWKVANVESGALPSTLGRSHLSSPSEGKRWHSLQTQTLGGKLVCY